MRDFLGNELKLGNSVIVSKLNYQDLVKAKIVAFTPTKIHIEYNTIFGVTSYPCEPEFLVLYNEQPFEVLK